MANPRTGNIERQDSESEHIGPDYTGDNISAKRSAQYAYDVSTSQWKRINTKTLGTQLETTDSGVITNTIIHGKTTAGGGSYVDVKVNPSGALSVESTTAILSERYDVEGTTVYVGQATPGALESDPDWTIIKYDLADMTAGSGKVASGVAWSDHTTETYV